MIRQQITLAICLACLALSCTAQEPSKAMVVVVGAHGTAEYGEEFDRWAERWLACAESLDIPCEVIGREQNQDQSDKASLRQFFESVKKQNLSETWIILIGHGTFQRNVAKFNLRGEDVSAAEVSQWMKGSAGRSVFVNCASASGAFIEALSAPNRVVVTGTKSGNELNFARFGDFLSESIADAAADLDHDDEVSLLEAFLSASGKVSAFYESDSRLATEHALIDDNGDKRGSPLKSFRDDDATGKGQGSDGRESSRIIVFRTSNAVTFSAEQIRERSEIETRLEALRQSRQQFDSEEAYLSQLEPVLIEMAQLYARAEPASDEGGLSETNDSDEAQK